jgi:hypothetical protein
MQCYYYVYDFLVHFYTVRNNKRQVCYMLCTRRTFEIVVTQHAELFLSLSLAHFTYLSTLYI